MSVRLSVCDLAEGLEHVVMYNILVMQLHKLYVMTDKMLLPARSRDAIAQGCLCITVMGVTPDAVKEVRPLKQVYF